jgi:uncharacterized OsmC-like protein
MSEEFAVVAAAGSFRGKASAEVVVFPHRWTAEGVAVESPFTGAHLLHLAAAACVLNDLYREASGAGVELRGVRVAAKGSFDTETWESLGIDYRVEVDSPSPADDVDALIRLVDGIAEIPRAIRAGAPVSRAE